MERVLENNWFPQLFERAPKCHNGPVKRWLVGLVLPLLTCFAIFLNRSESPDLLTDTDTRVMLSVIRERNAPASWFLGDWPLSNHFYRPISTLVFEFDNAVYGDNAAGYGRTNAFLAIAAVLALYWLCCEALKSATLASFAATLFGLCHLGYVWSEKLADFSLLLAGVSLIGLFRGQRWRVVLAATSLVFLSTLWSPPQEFASRVTAWIPGRTASSMTLMCLVSVAAYCRYERLSGRNPTRARSSIDPPATKSSTHELASGRKSSKIWAVASIGGAVLALLCYEQAVMLPAIVTLLFVWYKSDGRNPNGKLVAIFWLVLLAYVAVRATLVPSSASGYQLQQFRNGGGVVMSVMDYLLPTWNWGSTLVLTLSTSWIILLTAPPWWILLKILGNFNIFVLAWKHPLRGPTLAWFGASVLAFLPMAWLQPFGHYHYWPAALRSIAVVLFAKIGLDAWTSAISLPSLQAPKRPSPAPGSLLRQ